MGIQTRQDGFTLIEMIISLVVLSLLGAAAGYGLTGGALAFSSSDISTMNPGTLGFTKRDGTGVTLTSTPPLVTLAYTSPAGSHTLTNQVSSLAFAYYQSDGTTAATGNGDVAFIEFELVLTRDGNNYPQRSRVALRNQQ